MRIASLGRSARGKSGVKVRQPLGRALVRPRVEDEELLALIMPQVLDELNVKAVELAADYEIAEIEIKPNLPVLGPKLGAQLGAARKAIAAAAAASVAATLRAEGSVTLDGMTFDAGDLLVEMNDKSGIAAASEGAVGSLLVGVDTTLTPELEAEGLAREIVHRIQGMRRTAGFDIEDRIVTYAADPAPEVVAVLATHGAYIRQETLSDTLLAENPPAAAHTEQHDMDGTALTLGVARAE